LCPNLRIGGHLPAPVVNAFDNSRISDFQKLVTLTLDRVILHTYCMPCIIHWPLPTYQISLNRRNFLWMGGHLRPTLLGRLGRVDLKTDKHINR